MKKFWLLGISALLLAATAYLYFGPLARRATIFQAGPGADLPPPLQTAPAQLATVRPVSAPVVVPTSPASQVVAKKAPLTPPPAEVAAFDAWIEKFRHATKPAEQAALAVEGETLAQARHQAMAQLIQSDPQRALASTVPYAVRQQLPPSVASQLEQMVSGRGNLKVIVTDPPAGQLAQGSKTSYQVTLKGRTYEAYPYGRRTQNIGLEGIALHGVATTDEQGKPIIAVSPDPVRVLEAAEVRDLTASQPALVRPYCPVDGRAGGQVYGQLGQEVYAFCDPADAAQYSDAVSRIENSRTLATQARRSNVVQAKSSRKGTPPDQLPPANPSNSQGIKHLLMLPVLFPDDPRPPVSMDGIWGECAFNNQYYEDGSYGTFSWISTVTPYLTLPYPKYVYGEGSQVRNGMASIVGDASTAAAALGYLDPSDDRYTVFT